MRPANMGNVKQRQRRSLNTLRIRLTLWSLVVNALLLMAFGLGVWLILRQVQNRQIDETLQLSASQLVDGDELNRRTTIPDDHLTALEGRGIVLWVIDPDGNVIQSTGQAASLTPPDMQEDLQNVTVASQPYRVYRRVLTSGKATLLFGLSLIPLQQTLQTVAIIVGATIPLALIVSALGSILLANNALRPIATITAQAKRISRENLSERLGFTTQDEVGQLAQTFDGMLDRLQAAFEQERQFVGNASHELRTPLGILKAQISLALSRPRDMVTLQEMLQAMDGDVDRLTRLVEKMLNLIRVESTPIIAAPVDLSDLLDGLISQLQPLATEQHIDLTIEFGRQTVGHG